MCLLLQTTGAAAHAESLRHMNDGDEELIAGLCYDFKRLTSVRLEREALLHHLLKDVTKAEDHLDKIVDENDEYSLDVARDLVEFLDAKAASERCKSERKSLQLSFQTDAWEEHAIALKENATKEEKASLKANFPLQNTIARSVSSQQRHWDDLYRKEKDLYDVIHKEELSDHDEIKYLGPKCSHLANVYAEKWRTFEDMQTAVNSTLLPLSQAEVDTDYLLQEAVEHEVIMWKAVEAQKKIQEAGAAADKTDFLRECPSAETLVIDRPGYAVHPEFLTPPSDFAQT